MYGNDWQPQPYSMPPARPALVGKVISSINETTPNDVPMDGTLGVFPLVDGTAVFTKRWRSDGTIETIEYRPTTKIMPNYSPIEKDLLDRVVALENRFSKEAVDESISDGSANASE